MSGTDKKLPPEVPGTEPPIREFVVNDPDPKRLPPEEEKRASLSWLWWLLGLIVLGLLVWWLVRSCGREAACTTVPDAVFTHSAQATAVEAVDQWVPGVAYSHSIEVVNALRVLCDARLSTGAGWHGNNAVANAFSAFAPQLEPTAITNIENLVNGNSFCRCG